MGVDTTYGRNPNGSSNWAMLTPPTKGASNGTGGGATLPLVMNEVFSRGVDPDFDWVENRNDPWFGGQNHSESQANFSGLRRKSDGDIGVAFGK